MRVGIVTQARTTSTRLPGKVLLDLGGRSVLGLHLDRLATTGFPVVVATTENPTDDPVVEIAHSRGASVHRGSELDVLSRFAGAAAGAALDVVVRVTSDCPLIDGQQVTHGVAEFVAANDPDLYVTNTQPRTFPRGLDYEVFSAAALAEAHRSATDPAEREHVTPYLYQNRSGRTTIRNCTWHEDKSTYRVTLDTDDDLRLLRMLVEDHDAAGLDSAGLIALLDEHPELVAINAHVEQRKLG